MLSEEEILNVLRSEVSNTIGTSDFDSELGKQRADAIDYYHGKMDDFPPLPGWSKITTRDVFETVEAAMPDLMQIFASSEDVMEFIPETEEDVDRANQETDVVNHVFHQQNSGFLILYTYIKDALQAKNGFTKVWWEDKETDEEEHYFGIDDDALAALRAEENIDITDVETTKEKTGEFTPKIEIVDGVPARGKDIEIVLVTHDVVAKRSKDASGVRVQSIVPEEVAVSRESRSLKEAALVRHVPKDVTRSQLIEMGIDKTLVNSLRGTDEDDTEEEIARDTLFQDDDGREGTINRPLQKVDVADNYLKIDVNENGRQELWHIMTGNDDTVMLSKTRITRCPISTMTPIIEPHQVFGLSLADLVMDLQRVNTFLTRAALDNAAAMNNQRPIISESQTAASTIDDVLMNRPGAPILVRGDARTALTYAPNNNIAPEMISLVEYFNNVRDKRTGIVRASQGIDPNAIRKDISATEFAGQQSNLLKTIKLIARIFAETGIKDMMLNIHHSLQSHAGDKELSFRINGGFVNVNPREWKTRTDMQINVGLGTGTKQEQIIQLTQILQEQKVAFAEQGKQDGPLVTLAQIRNTLARIVELQGFKTADAFFNKIEGPVVQPEQEQQQDPAILKITLDAQNDADSNRIQEEKNIRDSEIDLFQIIAELQLKAESLGQELNFKETVAMAELALKDKKINLEAESEGVKIGINAAERLETITTDLTPDVRVGGDIAG